MAHLAGSRRCIKRRLIEVNQTKSPLASTAVRDPLRTLPLRRTMAPSSIHRDLRSVAASGHAVNRNARPRHATAGEVAAEREAA